MRVPLDINIYIYCTYIYIYIHFFGVVIRTNGKARRKAEKKTCTNVVGIFPRVPGSKGPVAARYCLLKTAT